MSQEEKQSLRDLYFKELDVGDFNAIKAALLRLQTYIQKLPNCTAKIHLENIMKKVEYVTLLVYETIIIDLPHYLPSTIDKHLKEVREYSSKIEELEPTIRDEISERVRNLLWDLMFFRRKFPEQFPNNILYNPNAPPTPVPLNQYFVSYAHRLVK